MNTFKLNANPLAMYTDRDVEAAVGLMVPTLLRVDSYKGEHWWAMNQDVEFSHLYIEARKGQEELMMANVTYFAKILSTRITEKAVDFATAFWKAHSGADYNIEGWKYIAQHLGGRLPLEVKAVPEGSVAKPGTPILIVRNTVPGFAWVVNYFGDMLLRIWKSCSVAGRSFRMKRTLKACAMETMNDEDIEMYLPYAINDFGSRAVGTSEESAVSGIGHAMNFRGSDNMEATYLAMQLYGLDLDQIPTNSVFAIEHNVLLSYDREMELPTLLELAMKVLKEGRIGSLLIDTYDIDAALQYFNDHYLQLQEAWYEGDCKGKLVYRPDSGHSVETPITCFEKMAEVMDITVNGKGFRQLPSWLDIIQGDGVGEDMLKKFTKRITGQKISLINFVFGCGGELIANHTRDDSSWAAKVSVNTRKDGKDYRCSKSPKYGRGKRTKEGYFRIFADENGELAWEESEYFGDNGLMTTYFRNGEVKNPQTWEEVVATANSFL